MSTLKVNTIQDSSGANSSTPSAIANGIAKAWVNFNGQGVISIRASYNVTSITDGGTGNYTVNYTNSFADVNYVITAHVSEGGAYGSQIIHRVSESGGNNPTASNTQFLTLEANSGSTFDAKGVYVAIFR